MARVRYLKIPTKLTNIIIRSDNYPFVSKWNQIDIWGKNMQSQVNFRRSWKSRFTTYHDFDLWSGKLGWNIFWGRIFILIFMHLQLFTKYIFNFQTIKAWNLIKAAYYQWIIWVSSYLKTLKDHCPSTFQVRLKSKQIQ